MVGEGLFTFVVLPMQSRVIEKSSLIAGAGILAPLGVLVGEFDVSQRRPGASKSDPKALPGNFERHHVRPQVLCIILRCFLFNLD